MGYGALSAADYFDVNAGDANPKVYSFKQGRNGWSAGAATYLNTKPLGSSAVTPGTFVPGYSFVQGTTGNCGAAGAGETGAALVRCVGSLAIVGASSGFGAWADATDANYRPVDIRETVPSGQYILDNAPSGTAYSFNIPYKDLFKADTDGDLVNDYNNLKMLDQSFSGTNKYVFYNRTQHTGISAGMGGRMLGYDSVGIRDGIAHWNNIVGEKFMGSTVGTLMTGQPGTGNTNIYGGTISTLHPLNSGLNLAPTITSGPIVMADVSALNSVKIKWDTDYPATTMINDKDTYNDTVLNTSHEATLSGLSIGTYTCKAISYDCVANANNTNVNTGTCDFIFADVKVMPSTLNLNSQGNYVTARIGLPAGYDCNNIDTNSIKLQGSLPAVSAYVDISGSHCFTAKFDRAAVGILVGVPGTYVMAISAMTTDATPIPIVGSSIMNVIQ